MQYGPDQPTAEVNVLEVADMHDCIRIGQPFEYAPGAWRVALDFSAGKVQMSRDGGKTPSQAGSDTFYVMYGPKTLAQQAFDVLKLEVRP